jgi:hypothetical protein
MSNFGNEKFAMECCDKLVALQAWPFSKVNVERWLSNFEEQDRIYALHMVSQFMYFSDQLVDAQFLSAFQNISNVVLDDWKVFPEAKLIWNDFLNRCLIVPVQGEEPSPADSGYTFARKARQILRIPEDRLAELDTAIEALLSGHNIPIVFVDDFVGSGEQFTKTLARQSRRAGFVGQSIQSAARANPNSQIFYCNVAMTSKGKDRVLRDCPSVILSSGNILGPEYSWTTAEGSMWPDDQRLNGISMIEKYSKRLGYADENGSENDWQGFHSLGLGLAFEHSTPDASLPIFFSERNGWSPLVTRR